MDQITAKAYLDQNVFGFLEESLNNLLETIERNGEFEKYVEMLADRQEKEQRELRRRAREMKRLELGDAYISSGSEGSANDSDNDESYGEESGAEHYNLSQAKSEYNSPSPTHEGEATTGQMGEGLRSEFGDGSVAANQEVINEQFNPLRYIALHLKELNEARKMKK